MSLRAVIFDYGKVLSHDQDPVDVAEMKQITGLEGALFENLYWKHRDSYDAGDITGAGYWRKIAEDAGVAFTPETLQRLVEVDARSWSHVQELSLNWARELSAAGLKIGILSNMHKDLREYLTAHFTWVPEFDYALFSCDAGMVKPEAAIYGKVLEGLRVKPEEALFLDDRLPNIEAAQRAGIHGIEVLEVADAIREAARQFRLPMTALLGKRFDAQARSVLS